VTSIRTARPHELQALWAIRERSARVGCAHAYSPMQLDAWLSGPLPQKVAVLIEDQCVVVAEREGTLVGYGALDPGSQEVEAVFVDPSAAGLGVGRALLDAVETLAISKGILALRLDATPNAESFYQAAGYVAVRRIDHTVCAGIALPAIVMLRQLSAAD
jgi:putative acetyltransferase